VPLVARVHGHALVTVACANNDAVTSDNELDARLARARGDSEQSSVKRGGTQVMQVSPAWRAARRLPVYAEAVAQCRLRRSCLWFDHNAVIRGSEAGCETSVYRTFRVQHLVKSPERRIGAPARCASHTKSLVCATASRRSGCRLAASRDEKANRQAGVRDRVSRARPTSPARNFLATR
jgi:hypothetical protein